MATRRSTSLPPEVVEDENSFEEEDRNDLDPPIGTRSIRSGTIRSREEDRDVSGVESPTRTTGRRPGISRTPLDIDRAREPLPRSVPTGRPILSRTARSNTEVSELIGETGNLDDLLPSRPAKIEATAEPPSRQDHTVLFTRKSPQLSVETIGPRQISVGKESSFEISILNTGDVSADDVMLYVDLPPWADVLGAEVSVGSTYSANAGEAGGAFRWKIGSVPAASQERLVLSIMPRESRPFDLGVQWDCRPVASQTMIEVQEPKLDVTLEGPREVMYGEKQIFKLRLANTGTGDAENVMIVLQPIGTGDNQPVSHKLGLIEAGKEKNIEVELTARQVGNLLVKVEVRADAGIHVELAEKVLVRRAGLQLDLRGPNVQYVGTVAKYRIRVHNPGTAPAKNVQLSVDIPAGAKYLSGVDGSRVEANGTKLIWNLERLEEGSERIFVINCSLGLPGAARMKVVSTAEGDLIASTSAATRVEAMADLVLDVKDPSGPVPVGGDALYELRIRNRGTKTAKNVQVVTYFSNGIEPLEANGCPHQIRSGQVTFSPIPSVAAGEDVVLTIRARAETAGNHIFRTEVHCRASGSRLVSEESTLFYKNDSISNLADEKPSKETSWPPERREPARTAERPQSPVAEQSVPLRTADRYQRPAVEQPVPVRTVDRRQGPVAEGNPGQPIPAGPPRR